MNKSTAVYSNGQSIGNLYQKQDGTYTTWSGNDKIAAYLTFMIVGATILNLLA